MRLVSHISTVTGSNLRFYFSSELFFEGPNGKASSIITASSGLQAPVNIGMSIMHRASGAVLATGSLILVIWLTALAAGDDVFASVTAALHHPVGQLVCLATH